MKCQEARGLLIHYANGETSRSERELLQAHLAQCESCFRHAQSLSAVEQQVRNGLHTAADSAEPSPMAWQTLSHKLAHRRGHGGHATAHTPLPIVWRLMGGLSATLAFAVLVGAAVVAPGLRATQAPAAITEDARPLEAGTLDPLVEGDSQSTDSATSAASDSDGNEATAGNVRSSSLPQRQVRALLRSEPDSFLPKLHNTGHDEPEPESILPTNCSYCLKMR